MKRLISINVWSLQQLSFTSGIGLFEIIDIVSSLGVDGIDIGEDYLRIPKHFSLQGLKDLREKVEREKLLLSSVWFYTDIVGAARVTSVATVIEQLKNYLAVAEYLRSPVLCIPPGDAWKGVDPKEGHNTMLQVFEKLLPVAEASNVVIGLEIGRAAGVFQSPEYALKLVREVNSPYLTICPDFEAWRIGTQDLPLTHVEASPDQVVVPSALSLFQETLPYSYCIHAKLLRFDENGEEPHFPIKELMDSVKQSPKDHILNIEYEGWIPDIDPHLDCIDQTRRCIDLLRRHLK